MEAIEVTGTLSAPDLSQLTTVSLNGTGAFDKLMATTKLHLVEEYEQERLSKDEYATVYLGALQSVLAQSVQFLLNHQSEEKIIAEIGLIRQKTVSELAQTDNTLKAGLGFNDGTLLEGLMKNQLDITEQQILESVQKVESEKRNVALVGQQIVTELAQSADDLSGANGTTVYGFNTNYTAIEGVLKAGIDKTTAEEELVKQKVVTEVGQVSDALPTTYGKSTNSLPAGVLASSVNKIKAEIDLLDQKTVSELAQTEDTVPVNEGIGAGGSVAGVIGKQKLLFAKQTDGFDRDAEQKLVKIMTDSMIARIAADSGTVLTDSYLNNKNIGVVMQNAIGGIGSTPADPNS
jgi:hypothetical protein